MGILVGGIKILTTLGVSTSSRYVLTFWQELEDLLGPILGPIIRGFFEPIYRTFEDPFFRTQALNIIIWTAMIIGGLVFIVYETPGFINWIMGSQSSPSKRPVASRAIRPRVYHPAADQHQITKSKVEEERERRRAVVEASGVKVQSIIKRVREDLILDVIVNNDSGHQIDMVVADIDLPADISIAIGSFRMQRLGTIRAGETQVAEFRLSNQGGDISKIGGHVEFLSASYEVSKIQLPSPEIRD